MIITVTAVAAVVAAAAEAIAVVVAGRTAWFSSSKAGDGRVLAGDDEHLLWDNWDSKHALDCDVRPLILGRSRMYCVVGVNDRLDIVVFVVNRPSNGDATVIHRLTIVGNIVDNRLRFATIAFLRHLYQCELVIWA